MDNNKEVNQVVASSHVYITKERRVTVNPPPSFILSTLLLTLSVIMIIRLISEEGDVFMIQGRSSPNKLAAYVGLAHPILIRVAKEEGCIFYKDLLAEMKGKPGMPYIGKVLNRIAELELEAHNLKLTAVVVRVDTEEVGGGFFGLSGTPRNLKRASPEELKNRRLSANDRNYWHKQLARVHKECQSLYP